jgi:hypothetical protein
VRAVSDRLYHRGVSRQRASIYGVWVLVAVGAVLVGLLLPPGEAIGWLPIVLALGMLVAFSAQLALRTVEGLVTRLAVTASGAIVLLVVATAVLWLVAR